MVATFLFRDRNPPFPFSIPFFPERRKINQETLLPMTFFSRIPKGPQKLTLTLRTHEHPSVVWRQNDGKITCKNIGLSEEKVLEVQITNRRSPRKVSLLWPISSDLIGPSTHKMSRICPCFSISMNVEGRYVGDKRESTVIALVEEQAGLIIFFILQTQAILKFLTLIRALTNFVWSPLVIYLRQAYRTKPETS